MRTEGDMDGAIEWPAYGKDQRNLVFQRTDTLTESAYRLLYVGDWTIN